MNTEKEETALLKTISANLNPSFEILERDKHKIHVLLEKPRRSDGHKKIGNINLIHSFDLEEFSRLQYSGAFSEAGFSNMEFLHDPRN